MIGRWRERAVAPLSPACALLLLGMILAAPSAAAPRRPELGGISDARSAVEPHWACPQGLCDAIVDPRPATALAAPVFAAREPEGGGEEGGYDPEDLRGAYAIPAGGGTGQTVAVVEGFGYREAEKDLARYRAHYRLPPCTSKTGCLTIVNSKGVAPHYPAANGWELEDALDLDMASAACPECHIVQVDAEGEGWDQLGRAVNRAATLGAVAISNSYGLPEETCEAQCVSAAPDFDHPGVLVTVASGDSGWDNSYEGGTSPSYPADQADVVAVGGTALRHSTAKRGWSETVWGEPGIGLGSGSGCTLQPKPSWQHDTGCAGRTDNDVAAVGACATPVSVYDSDEGGWADVCGTSVSSPLVAGIEAHATAYARSLQGQAFYEPGALLFPVTAGSNGRCATAVRYLCHGEPGYDAPSGNGTPDGALQLSG